MTPALDVFTIGCVIAELYISGLLFPDAIDSPREHLAHVERILGEFPRDFALQYECRIPGTFQGLVKPAIIFPVNGMDKEQILSAMQRLERTRPLRVSQC